MVDSYIMRMKDGVVVGKGIVPFEHGRGRILCCNLSGADAHYPEGTPMAKMEWVNLEDLEMVSVDTDVLASSQEQSHGMMDGEICQTRLCRMRLWRNS